MRGADDGTEDLKVTSAWDVFRTRREPSPPNPLRYSHSFWLALGVFALAIALTIAVIPARSIELDMVEDARQAKADGFPDLPPGALGRPLADWMREWRDRGVSLPSFSKTEALALRVLDYEGDSALLNLGVVASLAAFVLLAAIGFVRALSNLYALGYGPSVLSPAWALVSWLLPVLSFVLPWRMVVEVTQCAWQRSGDEVSPRWPMVLAGLWGLSFIGLWLFNPITVNVFMPRDDIDDWITHIQWTQWMLTWLPVPAFFTAGMLLMVAFRQHVRYIDLDRLARARREANLKS